MKISKFDELCSKIACLVIKLFDFLIDLFGINTLNANNLIKESDNILNLKTHIWNKKYINFEKDLNVFCKICNIRFTRAMYESERDSVRCTEHQIKRLLE